MVGEEIQVAQRPNDVPRNAWASTEPAGAEEFAIYGWFKWENTAMETWPNLFRVSFLSTLDGSDLRNLDYTGER